MKAPRPVSVSLSGQTWFVRYEDRRYGQRHLAAQFYAPDNSFDDVIRWVNANPNLKYVGDISPCK